MKNATLGDTIKLIRVSLGLTMEQFGQLLNASKGNVSLWESNKIKPNNTRLKQIADIGGIPLSSLLNGLNEKEIISTIDEIAKFLTSEKNNFPFTISILIKELTPFIKTLPQKEKTLLFSLIYQHLTLDIKKELLLLIAKDFQ